MAHKVLIIEDEPDVAKLLVLRFRAAGFEVRHVPDALFGFMESRSFAPDVIVLDLMLPAGGGLTALQQIRQSVHTSHIPIIVYTGKEDTNYKKQVEECGVQAYFQKPYDHQKIVEKALQLIKEGGSGV